MKERIFCQSCGMPISSEETAGTNTDGTRSKDYCVFCFQKGSFTQDVTMEEMIQISLGHMQEIFKSNPEFHEDEALEKMNEFFPELKRWKK